MGFKISGLPAEGFAHLYGLPEEALARQGVVRMVADAPVGFPCRVEMREARPGERLLLLNHVSQPAPTPYRASHAIFVIEGALRRYEAVDEVPAVIRTRLLSLRAFDAAGMMLDAEVVEGGEIERVIEQMFGRADAACIHVHNARRGCYAGLVEPVR